MTQSDFINYRNGKIQEIIKIMYKMFLLDNSWVMERHIDYDSTVGGGITERLVVGSKKYTADIIIRMPWGIIDIAITEKPIVYYLASVFI